MHPRLDLAIAGDWRNSARAAVQIASQSEPRSASTRTSVRIPKRNSGGRKDRGGILESARYDLALTSWSPALDPDRSYLFGCAATPPGGGNSMFFCDPAYDADEAAGAQRYELAQRAPYYRDAGSRLVVEIPVLPLGFERRTYVVSRSLAGFRPNPLGRDYWNVWQFHRV